MKRSELEQHLKDTNLFKLLDEYPSAFKEMFATKGWEIWITWVEAKRKEFQREAMDGSNPAVREEARIMYLALELFCNYPQFLATLQLTGASTVDSPSSQESVTE